MFGAFKCLHNKNPRNSGDFYIILWEEFPIRDRASIAYFCPFCKNLFPCGRLWADSKIFLRTRNECLVVNLKKG